MPAAMPDQAVANDPGGVRLHPSWRRWLDAEFQLPYMQALRAFLAEEKRRRKVIYPRGASIFAALDSTPFEQVRVVIIGQDPYHGPGQAHGLCFSVQPGVPEPPSLHNIFAEINDDLGALDEAEGRPRRRIPPGRGCLSSWAQQGVLLLNAVLTVRAHQANSHQGKGWEHFTDEIIRRVDAKDDAVVFILWGAYARRKKALVRNPHHVIIESAHPSPLSASRGFFGSRPFSRANELLAGMGAEPVDWRLP